MTIDPKLIHLMISFFVMGFVYAGVVLRLPKAWWPAWFIWSTFGIFVVVTTTVLYLGRLLWGELFLIFLSALPGMIHLNYQQWQYWLKRQNTLLDQLETGNGKSKKMSEYRKLEIT